MDLINNVEIYIPKNAEVKCVPLQSFPSSVLKQIDHKLSDSHAFATLTDASQGTWICPVMIRSKGQPKAASSPGAIKNMSSVLGTHIRRKPGPLHMTFVTCNQDAYQVLKNTMPGRCSSRNFQLPEGSAPKGYQNAVIIYRECVFLSIKNLHQDHTQQDTQKTKPINCSAFLPDSSISSSCGIKESRNKGKKATQKVKHLEHKPDVTYSGEDDLLSAKFRRHAGQPSASVDQDNSEHHVKASGEQIVVEKLASPAHSQLYLQEERIKDFIDDFEMQNQCPEVVENLESRKRSPVIGHSSHSQGADGEEPLCADVPFTFHRSQFDFSALEKEEKIAEMKAKLQQSQTDLKKCLTSSK